MGFAWSCHFYLYEAWKGGGPCAPFAQLRDHDFRFSECSKELQFEKLRPVGHILDPDFTIESVNVFHPCEQYGRCIGCDTKVKNNRFQCLDDANTPHTSVQIRKLELPDAVRARIEHPDGARPPVPTPEVAR